MIQLYKRLLASVLGCTLFFSIAILSGCGGGSSSTGTTATGDFVITSTTDNSHNHAITVKAADLAAGAQVVYLSTLVNAHTHTVTITPSQINDINEGKLDNISSSVSAGHAHDFPVKKP